MPLARNVGTRKTKTGLTRREVLFRSANGFGALALATMLAEEAAATDRSVDPLLVRTPHFAPKAKSVIFLFMDGGPSHMDTFESEAPVA